MHRRGCCLFRSNKLGKQNNPSCNVIDIGEVKGVFLTLHTKLIAKGGSTRKGRNNAILMVIDTAIDVGQTDRAGLHSGLRCLCNESLPFFLGAAIDVHRMERHVFTDRKMFRVPIDFSTARGDHPRSR